MGDIFGARMTALHKMGRLNVTATSPDRSVCATATALDGVSVRVKSEALADNDEKTLAGQVSAAVGGALRGMRSGEAEVLREAASEFSDDPAAQSSLTEALRSLNDDPPDVEAMKVSAARNVKMRMDGYDRVELRIKPDALNSVTADSLVHEINDTVAETVREYGRLVCESRQPTSKETTRNAR